MLLLGMWVVLIEAGERDVGIDGVIGSNGNASDMRQLSF